MGNQTAIQWTEKTWNPWHGCHKVSDGCKFCYMFRDKERYGQEPNTVLRSKSTFNAPLKWLDPALVFTCSWSDWFIEEADEYRAEAWEIIRKTPHLTYQILTKRPENIEDRLPTDWGSGYPNVWLGVSVENEARRGRIDILKNIPAKIRFVSFEPLLSQIFTAPVWYQTFDVPSPSWADNLNITQDIHWAIIGGESGNENGKYKYRPCELKWIESLLRQLKYADVKVFVKQLGTYLAKELNLKDSHGGNPLEWPESLRIREMPV